MSFMAERLHELVFSKRRLVSNLFEKLGFKNLRSNQAMLDPLNHLNTRTTMQQQTLESIDGQLIDA